MGENAATQSNQNRQVGDISVEMASQRVPRRSSDDDGGQRTGTLWTAAAHVITAMVGVGVLSTAGNIAELGWIAVPAVVFLFSFMSYYTSCLLADCYRNSKTQRRNPTYMDCVQSILVGTGGAKAKAKACGFIQYLTIFGTAVRITIAASIGMMAINDMHCSRKSNWENECYIFTNPHMILFGITEMLMSLIPNFDEIWWVSVVATVMSLTYSLITIGLGIAQVAANGIAKGSLTGISTGAGTATQKIWKSFTAAGSIATAYSFSDILIEIEDTIGSPREEATTMKKAIAWSTVVLTTIYMLCGCMGYAAFGDATPENLLTSYSFDKPFWLLVLANAAFVISLVGEYQLYCQPIFAFVEKKARQRWPASDNFVNKERRIPVPEFLGQYKMNLFRLVWRTVFVVLTTAISMLFPSYNAVVEIITLGFWPLAVYFPVEMYIKQKEIGKWSTRWVCLQMLSMACLGISITVTAGSIAELKDDLKDYQPFTMWF